MNSMKRTGTLTLTLTSKRNRRMLDLRHSPRGLVLRMGQFALSPQRRRFALSNCLLSPREGCFCSVAHPIWGVFGRFYIPRGVLKKIRILRGCFAPKKHPARGDFQAEPHSSGVFFSCQETLNGVIRCRNHILAGVTDF